MPLMALECLGWAHLQPHHRPCRARVGTVVDGAGVAVVSWTLEVLVGQASRSSAHRGAVDGGGAHCRDLASLRMGPVVAALLAHVSSHPCRHLALMRV